MMTEGRLLQPLPERDWKAYSKSQVEEVRLFDLLLTDLLAPLALDPDAPKGPGRPAVPAHELAWVAVKKAHTGYSGRRNQGHVLDAQQGGLLARAPRYNAAMEFLNRDDAEAILRGLVRSSALPLAGIEQDFAVDSTGFACGTFGTYRHTRYGETKKRKWVKLHACIGVRFNAVTDAVVTMSEGAGTGDTANFAQLVEGTAEGFAMREVSADAAYASKANLHTARRLGADALIPFPEGRNAPGASPRGKARSDAPGYPGSYKLWRKAYHYFKFNEEEFYSRYHKRSNVEATFGAIKQTIGERLKAKNPVAQRNEVLCKVIAWNIRCVVRAMMEVGAEPVFGGKAPPSSNGAPHCDSP